MSSPSSQKSGLLLVIYRSSSIGDAVLATACLNFTQQNKLTPTILWIGSNPSLELICAAHPDITPINIKEIGILSAFSKLRQFKSKQKLYVNLQKNLNSRLLGLMLSLFAGFKSVSCSKYQIKRLWLITLARISPRKVLSSANKSTHRFYQFEIMAQSIKNGLNELGVLNVNVENHKKAVPSLPLSLDANHTLTQVKHPILAIAPGAAHETKRCPEDKFIEVLTELKRHFAEESGYPSLVFLGSRDAVDPTHKILKAINWPENRVYDYTNKTSLVESARILKAASILLSNDSSLIHIAEANNTDVAALFGPTVAEFGFAPWRETSRLFASNLSCRPCSKHGKILCRFADQLCFNNIQANAVAHFIASRLFTQNHENVGAMSSNKEDPL